MIRKFLVLLFLLSLVFSPKPVFASDYSSTFLDNLTSSLTAGILGTYDQNHNLTKPGAVDFFASGIGTMTTLRPASALDFTKYLSSRLQFPGAPKAVYAANNGGIGYTSLQPVLQLWTIFRNIAYLFFAVAFVIAGIMIMFRIKIDPKTVITIQSALPKIIFALILVTFSYAIAGLLVDVMYVAIGLTVNLAGVIGGSAPGVTDFQSRIENNSIFSLWLGPVGLGVAGQAGVAVGRITYEFLRGPLRDVGGSLAQIITGSIAALIVAIVILWALFKTWLMLLSAYANIILNVIFAPIMLMLDAIPGQNQFDGWLRNMLAYLLSFPAVILLILVGFVLSSNFYSAAAGGGSGFVPPLIGGNNQYAIQALVGVAILLTIPKTVEALQKILKTPENKFGSAWSEALGWSWNQVSGRARGAAGGAWGRGSQYARNEAFGASADTFRQQYKEWLEAGGTGSGTPEPRPTGWGQRLGTWTGASKTSGKS